MYINTCHDSQKYGNVQPRQANDKIADYTLETAQITNTFPIPNKNMNLEEQKKLLNHELEQFNSILNEILPRYIELIKNKDISTDEEKELGEIEHFLIEVNAKIAEIKNKLDQDLFGETLNHYYKAKQEAINGDPKAKKRLAHLRTLFIESVQNDEFFKWN